MSESDESGEVCVEIPSGYVIARSVSFIVQSVLSEQTTAEGIISSEILSMFMIALLLHLQWKILWRFQRI